MEKPPQNAEGALNKESKLNKLKTEIEALRLSIGEAMLIKDAIKRQKRMEELLQKRLSKIAEYKNLGGSDVIN